MFFGFCALIFLFGLAPNYNRGSMEFICFVIQPARLRTVPVDCQLHGFRRWRCCRSLAYLTPMANYPDVPALLRQTTVALTQLHQALQTATDSNRHSLPDSHSSSGPRPSPRVPSTPHTTSSSSLQLLPPLLPILLLTRGRPPPLQSVTKSPLNSWAGTVTRS